MKYLLIFCMAICFHTSNLYGQQVVDPWTSSELLEPSKLAEDIVNGDTKNIIILSVGPEAIIKGSVDIGPTSDQQNVTKMRDYLKNVSKKKQVIIYCGCCPFVKCPNVRNAFNVLKEMGFKNRKLLNLPKNIKVDWLDKDYPVND